MNKEEKVLIYQYDEDGEFLDFKIILFQLFKNYFFNLSFNGLEINSSDIHEEELNYIEKLFKELNLSFNDKDIKKFLKIIGNNKFRLFIRYF
jgi:mevalonate pyrophosphate decarboxylase